MARHLNSNSMSPSLTMSLSIRSCFWIFSSLTKQPLELSRSAIWNSPPSYRMVACLRDSFLSESTTSQSAAVPMTFLPMRRRKSSPFAGVLARRPADLVDVHHRGAGARRRHHQIRPAARLAAHHHRLLHLQAVGALVPAGVHDVPVGAHLALLLVPLEEGQYPIEKLQEHAAPP